MVIVETSIFTRQVLELLPDDTYRELQKNSMNNELFEQLVASVREGGAIVRRETEPQRAFSVDGPNVKRVRANYQLSQNEFAALLGISVKTLRNWEQGRRKPEGPARVLLQVAAKHPDAVWDVVRPAGRPKRARAK